jgi:CBS domain containing-hemolysin-like protein
MLWFLTGCVVYLLILISERSLMFITPHEIEMLRADADDSPSARSALALADGGTRAALASLILARLLVMVLLVAISTGALVRIEALHVLTHSISTQTGLPPMLIWTVAVVLLGAAFAALMVGLQQLDVRKAGQLRSAFWLKRLHRFVRFWQVIMWPFVPKKLYSVPAAAAVKAALTGNVTPPVTTPELTREKRDLELLRSIVKFGEVVVRQVMQPRSKVVSLDTAMSYHDVLTTMKTAGFARYPVFDAEEPDSVTGILHAKDLVPFVEEADDYDWQQLVHPDPMMVPEVKYIDELLEQFKHKKRHMAIVVDEYGTIAGIVTMEDILEEVTGEIRDEFDTEQDEVPPYRQLNTREWLLSGQMHLNDVCRITGLAPGTFDEVRGDTDTLAGLLLEITGDMPTVGDTASWEDFGFEVAAADQRKITQVKLILPDIT